MENLREEVIANIRSVLISTKGSCDLRQLKSDYRMLMGCEIPFKKLNYNTLDDFVMSIDTLSVRKGPGGQIFLDAKSSEKTSHIADLVDRQKTKKKSRVPLRTEKRTFTNHILDKKWRPKNSTSRWKTSYENTPKLAAVNHNQFVNIPSAMKKPNLPPRLTKQLSVSNNSNNNNVKDIGECTDLRQLLQRKKQNNANNGEIKDLRMLLNHRKSVIFESDSSSSSSSDQAMRLSGSDQRSNNATRLPSSDQGAVRSEKTNRATLLLGIPRKNSPPVLSPIQVENLKNNSLAAVNMQSSVWDSWTSSDDSDVKSSQKLANFEYTGDNILDLYNFTQCRKLGEPSFKIVSRQTKPHKPVLYDCQIKVGTNTYSSYPVDFVNELAAKQHAAKLALDDLTDKYGKRKSLLLSTEQDILDRVPPIVEKHYHGIWNWQLEADYADMFHEQLPMNWLDIIDTSPKISVEAFLDNKYVLRYCKPEDKGKKSLSGVVVDVSVASNTVSFNDDGMLVAVVTCAVSAKEIWCRQIDTDESEAFHLLMQNLERTYTHIRSFDECAKGITEGGYYAAYYKSNWYRVRVFEINGDNVNCFLIDNGDELVITKDNIYNLKREFAKEQAQAFICRLAGLEELYEVSVASEHLHSLVGKTVQVETDSEELGKNDPNEPISVVLYDSDRNISINEELISLITIESASPVLHKNQVTEANVCHVDSTGDIYVHTNVISFNKLDSLLTELETTLLDKNSQNISKAIVTPETDKDRLYLYKCNVVEHWYRVRIVDWSPYGKHAQIYFVDYGKFQIITVANEVLYELDELDDIISQFPEQAIQVRMVIENIPSNFVEKVKELMPPDQLVLLKYIETDGDGIPCVKFFKRLEPDNILISISDNISFQSERTTANTNKPQKLQRLISLNQGEDGTTTKNVPSSGILKSPPLPEIGKYFDVKIPSAVNPWNFFVQPYDTHEKLSNLMKALQVAYKNVLHSPLQIHDIKPGDIYASKHDDGQWYRTSVIKIIHPGSISVFYCDFGYYANLAMQQLIPLDPHFMELPYQAIKAKLTGIKPKQDKWTMEDCKFFQKLVCRKSFVSILTSVEKDELYRFDTVLNLKLIDTSTKVDVYIDQVLIRRGIAAEAV